MGACSVRKVVKQVETLENEADQSHSAASCRFQLLHGDLSNEAVLLLPADSLSGNQQNDSQNNNETCVRGDDSIRVNMKVSVLLQYMNNGGCRMKYS